MRRATLMKVARRQGTDARCINPWRGMARHGKKLGAKRVRVFLRNLDIKELEDERTFECDDDYEGYEVP